MRRDDGGACRGQQDVSGARGCRGSPVSPNPVSQRGGHGLTTRENLLRSGRPPFSDYFGSRYYGSALGRWVTPDIVNLTEDRLLDPSNTLNKYVYAANNPLKFVDPDGEDITLFYTNGGTAVHAMLLAYDQSNGNSAVQSFGPADHSNMTEAKIFLGTPVAGTANYRFADIKSADQLRQEYSSVTIQTSPEETEKAIQYILNHSDGKYDTYTNNCTTTCSRILNLLNLHKWRENIPRSLFDNVVDEQGHGPNTNMPYVEQHGKDYGNPRRGYDAFHLLFLAIQRQQQPHKKPKEVVTHRICYGGEDGKQHCQ
ncbi:MAG: hypothetical protein JO041_13585 [Acidobacteria bacterium]|nr:hypothetical protein [Acidobacteriota bacterium]